MKKLSTRKKIIGIVAIITVALLGVAGYAYWSNGTPKKTDSPQDSAKVEQDGKTVATQEPVPEEASPTQVEQSNDGFMVVKEWDVKVAMRDAAKVQYEFKDRGVDSKIVEAGTYRQYVVMSIKPEFLVDKSCQGASLAIYQVDSYVKNSGWSAKEIGKHAYIITGSPYSCDGASDSPDNQLTKRILEDFKVENISSL